MNSPILKYIFPVLVVLFSCSEKRNQAISLKNDAPQLSIKHANAFDIKYLDGYKIVTLKTPWQGNSEPITYVLRNRHTPINDSISSLGQEIVVPIERLICNSTSQIILLKELGVLESLVGFPQTHYIYSPDIKERVKAGDIAEVGVESNLNVETILSLDPDMVMAFNTGREDRQLKKLKELGIPVVINADYMETSALGRAEWIKYMAVFFDEEVEAEAYFQKVESNYDSLKRIVKKRNDQNIMSGSLYGGSWYMPGGNNYGSLFMQDAGGNYLWADNENVGWLNLSFELVFERANAANIWIGMGSLASLQELTDADERYADFKAFKNKMVYSYVNRVNEQGANDYFESGTIRPDLVLADYIKMINPELLPEHELYYFKQLE
ncbi:MAG: ABC transporter substrate-binding protein [Cyclobacteriaceae bacterium]